MNCNRCGYPIQEGETVCRNCGTPVQPAFNPAQMYQQPPYQADGAVQPGYGQQLSYGQQPYGGQQAYGYGQAQGANPYGQQPYTQPQGANPYGQGQYQTPWSQEQVQKPKKKGKAGKLIAFIGGGVVLLGVIAFLVLHFLVPGAGGATERSYNVLMSYRSQLVLPEAGFNIVDFVNEDVITSTISSNGAGALLYTQDEIYYTDGVQLSLLGDKANIGYATISGDGSTVAYIEDSDALVYFRNGVKNYVTSGEQNLGMPVLSYNGAYLTYSVSDIEKNRVYGYTYDGIRSAEFPKNEVPFYYSNDGKYCYFAKLHMDTQLIDFSVRTGDNETTDVKLLSNINTYELSGAMFNADGTELMYAKDGKIYLCVKGGEPIKVCSGDYAIPILPYGAVYNGSAISVKSFLKSFIQVGDDVFYITSGGEGTKVVRNLTGSVYVAEDGKTLTYMKNGAIYQMNGTKEASEATQLAEDVYNFIPTRDGKTVYYTDDDGEIWSVSSSGKAVNISRDETAKVYFSYDGLYNGKQLFFILDGELYLVSGDKAEKVRGINQDVIRAVSYGSYLILDGEDGTLLSKDGKTFTVVKE